MSLHKIAQVSLFIIVSVVILLGVVSVYLIVDAGDTQEDELRVTESVPQEFAVVQQYVSECVRSVSERGIRLAGSQGGYIEPTRFGLFGNRANPTNADGVYLSERSQTFVPYWWFLASDNQCDGDCFFFTHYPPLEGTPDSVQNQLEQYIERELRTCVGSFASLVEAGYEISVERRPQATVMFRENDVRVYVEYPLTAQTGNAEQFISQYETILDVPFLRIYEYATLLLDVQINHDYVENVLLHAISNYQGTSRDNLPPFFGGTTNPVETAMWVTQDVKRIVQDILVRHIGGIQVSNAANYESRNFGNNIILERLTAVQTIPLQTDDSFYRERYSDFSVNFNYRPDWDIFFQLNNGQQVIKPSTLSLSMFPFLAVNEFRTRYDISFPYTVRISDPTAFSDSGYTFIFAGEGNIRSNLPLTESFERDFSLIDVLDAQGFVDDSTLYCDLEQRNSGLITGQVVNRKTQEPIPDVTFITDCGGESCVVTTTSRDGNISTQFPICLGGLLMLNHIEYAPQHYTFSTNLDQSHDLGIIELEPIQSVDIQVVKRPIQYRSEDTENPDNWGLSNRNMFLSPNERAVITLTQVNVPQTVQPHVASIVYSGDGTQTVDNIDLIPGLYEIEGTVLDLSTLYIPESRRCAGSWPFKTCFTIPEFELDSLVSATIMFTEESQYWRLTPQMLDNANLISFVVSGYDLHSVEEDRRQIELLELLEEHENAFISNVNVLQPIIQ
ncbi:MAG: hypothetical protein ACMXYA_01320 [Candidatus Woesearchaeota archaeon]